MANIITQFTIPQGLSEYVVQGLPRDSKILDIRFVAFAVMLTAEVYTPDPDDEEADDESQIAHQTKILFKKVGSKAPDPHQFSYIDAIHMHDTYEGVVTWYCYAQKS